MGRDTRIGVVGGTGAVGTVTLGLLAEHGFYDVRVFASARSAGREVQGHTVEEATPEALSRGDVDVFLFSVGTGTSRELVPHAVAGGAIAIDGDTIVTGDNNTVNGNNQGCSTLTT